MASVKKQKAKKLQAEASKATGRTRKGRNKVPTLSREDSPQRKGGKLSGNRSIKA
ncbi:MULTISPECIES: hypothetical protein [Myxococcaceae]|uniref:hypothetical protein n=1 Tax=Myxococcaceae TaxID=31 RepID=UPI00129C7177|nr:MULTISPECIES: hypothetical protein [Myxococcaceae]MBF5046646.1 hypothetical protein [Simulacricoccus sp. 17bor-14]